MPKYKICVPYVMVDVYEFTAANDDDAEEYQSEFYEDPGHPSFKENMTLEQFHKTYGKNADWDRYDFDYRLLK